MTPETFYHIYNRGNNKQKIFFNRDNYLYFLKKIRKHLLPHVDVVAYCLMPNHFHFLVYTKGEIEAEKFTNAVRVMLSSYTRAINLQEDRTGSLFQQNTKVKSLDTLGRSSRGTTRSGATTGVDTQYPFICFHYIHQNPVEAGLVTRMQDWEMSSYPDYAGLRDGTLCDKTKAYDFLEVPDKSGLFIEQSENVVV